MRLIDVDRLKAYQELLGRTDPPCLKGRGHKRIFDGDPWRIAWMFIDLGQVVEDKQVARM